MNAKDLKIGDIITLTRNGRTFTLTLESTEKNFTKKGVEKRKLWWKNEDGYLSSERVNVDKMYQVINR